MDGLKYINERYDEGNVSYMIKRKRENERKFVARDILIFVHFK